jgi:energy-coupling factor transport system substrate-specific component
MTDSTRSTPIAAPSGLSWRFSARDLINVAIFAAIYLAVTWVFGMLGMLGPLVWMISVPVTILVNGIVFTLFYTRVRHAGMILLFSVVVGLFLLLHAGTVVAPIATILLGIVAEVIAFIGRYRARWSGVVTYMIFGITAFAPFLPMVINRQAYFAGDVWQSMGSDYAQATETLLTPTWLLGLAVVSLLAGLIGGLFGTAVLRKHFVRAGLA